MRTLVSIVLSLLVSWPLLAGASPIDPTKTTCGTILVGNSSGADMGNGFVVITRDVGNIPVGGVSVAIRFLTSPARPLAQQNAGLTADCALGTLTGITNAQGQVVFHARVAGFDDQATPEVRGNGILIGHVLVRSTDLDGDGATTLSDLNAFRERFLHDAAAPETDFNHDGTTNILDFALLRDEYVRDVRGTLCP